MLLIIMPSLAWRLDLAAWPTCRQASVTIIEIDGRS
jgi:hypothetical protein